MTDKEPCRTAGEVRDLMTPNPITVKPHTPVREIWRQMTERRFRHMPVAEGVGRLIGIVTQRDLLAAHEANGKLDLEDDRPASAVMHRTVDTARPDSCVAEAARHMLRTKRSCLPVVDEKGTIIGILTEADYLRLATRGVPHCTCGGVKAATSY